jgi:hypothetical protein
MGQQLLGEAGLAQKYFFITGRSPGNRHNP